MELYCQVLPVITVRTLGISKIIVSDLTTKLHCELAQEQVTKKADIKTGSKSLLPKK